ncbi:LGFP repeat-containing protein [Mycolicibacterium komossense]|uniref:LGFP repeat-containing protein n=1 Tax=Mycolicibacterium komossense TaxID=1779 RepID=A0ABT3CDE6_9MYCO|nr:LGFP repeat-containing protein [Mycolicibacterium komossense]
MERDCTGGHRAVTRRNALKCVAAAPVLLGLGGFAPVLGDGSARAWADTALAEAINVPGLQPRIISREQWGADESMRHGTPLYDSGIKAGIVHHTATDNDYSPADAAGIVRSIYAYHTRTLGWEDIAYNALVDRYGQIFEGRYGGVTRSVEGSHTGGFNRNTWAVSMIGNFDAAAPTPPQLQAVGLLLGWRLAMDGIDPKGTVRLTSAGGPYTRIHAGLTPTLPSIFAHRDVGDTACPGSIGYGCLDQIRDIAARFNKPASAADLAAAMRGGAIYARWQAMGGMNSALGAPTSPETPGFGSSRYVTFDRGAMYWSPTTGAAPVTGAIYDAWATLGFERGALGLPTSGEIQEPQWIGQNFQHGTLNLDRQTGTITRVMEGVAQVLPPLSASGPPVQLERFSPARNRV